MWSSYVNRVGDPKNEELHENAFEDVERYMRARDPRRRITPGIYMVQRIRPGKYWDKRQINGRKCHN